MVYNGVLALPKVNNYDHVCSLNTPQVRNVACLHTCLLQSRHGQERLRVGRRRRWREKTGLCFIKNKSPAMPGFTLSE